MNVTHTQSFPRLIHQLHTGAMKENRKWLVKESKQLYIVTNDHKSLERKNKQKDNFEGFQITLACYKLKNKKKSCCFIFTILEQSNSVEQFFRLSNNPDIPTMFDWTAVFLGSQSRSEHTCRTIEKWGFVEPEVNDLSKENQSYVYTVALSILSDRTRWKARTPLFRVTSDRPNNRVSAHPQNVRTLYGTWEGFRLERNQKTSSTQTLGFLCHMISPST